MQCRSITSGPIVLLIFLCLIVHETAAAQPTDYRWPIDPYDGTSIVSPEEARFLAEQREWEGSGFHEQTAFPGIEDHVISYPYGGMPTFDPSNCPVSSDEVYEMLELGQEDNLPATCYRLYTTYIHYPQNTGSKWVDKVVKDWVIEKYGPQNPDVCVFTYTIGRPSPRYISIALSYKRYWMGGNGDGCWDIVQSYDLEKDRALALADVFPDMEHSEPLLEKYIYTQLWPEREDFEGLNPVNMKMDRLFLDFDGLYIVYNTHEQKNTGVIAYIPVADMPKLGGNTVFWEK